MKTIKITKLAALLILAAMCMGLMTACGSSESVTIMGSTSVLPYIENLAAAYEEKYEGKVVEVQGGGSATGIKAAGDGTADIGMSSRELTGDEVSLNNKIIAKDGLAIIVHPSNQVDDLTIEQIRDIYTKEITNWSEVGGADMEIHVYTREDGSGTRGAFEELVMVGDEYSIHASALVQQTNGSIGQAVVGAENAIGYISLGLADDIAVKSLKLEGVEATAENVLNTTYKLWRPFLFVMGDEVSAAAQDFIDFVLSDEGQELLVKEGLVSIR